MIRGEKVGLRARRESDIAVLHAGLYDDVATHSRADGRAWRPIPADSPASPLRVGEPAGNAAPFTVVQLADDDEPAGEASLWAIDLHNRAAHVGLSLLPSVRGRGLGTDTVRVLCHYGFDVLGLHRLQIETLTDNAAMIRAATQVGFAAEGTRRRAAWVLGEFVDEVVFGLLAEEWRR